MLEEGGVKAVIVRALPGEFKGGTSINRYFMMRPITESAFEKIETEAICWVSKSEAKPLIEQTTNSVGRKRDLEVLEAAYLLYENQANPQLVKGYGGYITRTMITIDKFRSTYGHWPSKLHLSEEAAAVVRDHHLTTAGYEKLQSKIQLIIGGSMDLVAEDAQGNRFDYRRDDWGSLPLDIPSDAWFGFVP